MSGEKGKPGFGRMTATGAVISLKKASVCSSVRCRADGFNNLGSVRQRHKPSGACFRLGGLQKRYALDVSGFTLKQQLFVGGADGYERGCIAIGSTHVNGLAKFVGDCGSCRHPGCAVSGNT